MADGAFPGGTPPLLCDNLTLAAGPGYGAQSLLSLLATLVSGVVPGGYAIGTWTPTLTPGTSGSVTMNVGASGARWTRVGRVVHISGYAKSSALVAPVGPISITGLPFVSGNSGANFAPLSMLYESLAAGITSALMASLPNNSGVIFLYKASAGGVTQLDSADLLAGSGFYFSGVFTV